MRVVDLFTIVDLSDRRKAGLSPEKAIDILKTIYSLTIVTPYSETRHTRLAI